MRPGQSLDLCDRCCRFSVFLGVSTLNQHVEKPALVVDRVDGDLIEASGSQTTLCWREMASNSQSRVSGDTRERPLPPLQPSFSAKARLALRTEGFDPFAEILRAAQAAVALAFEIDRER
jgi:hypothetical protein